MQSCFFRVVLGVIPGMIFLGTLACSLGIIAFAYFNKIGCDPYKGKFITNKNQVRSYNVSIISIKDQKVAVLLVSANSNGLVM